MKQPLKPDAVDAGVAQSLRSPPSSSSSGQSRRRPVAGRETAPAQERLHAVDRHLERAVVGSNGELAKADRIGLDHRAAIRMLDDDRAARAAPALHACAATTVPATHCGADAINRQPASVRADVHRLAHAPHSRNARVGSGPCSTSTSTSSSDSSCATRRVDPQRAHVEPVPTLQRHGTPRTDGCDPRTSSRPSGPSASSAASAIPANRRAVISIARAVAAAAAADGGRARTARARSRRAAVRSPRLPTRRTCCRRGPGERR